MYTLLEKNFLSAVRQGNVPRAINFSTNLELTQVVDLGFKTAISFKKYDLALALLRNTGVSSYILEDLFLELVENNCYLLVKEILQTSSVSLAKIECELEGVISFIENEDMYNLILEFFSFSELILG